VSPHTVFVNVEPEVLDGAPLTDLLAIADSAPGELRIVLEITERALAARPAELLRTVERVRDIGWGVALDDVGADSASLAFMALLEPDVVKLDLSLVQNRPSPAVAEIMNAVNAYAERSGALILAEGIETERHLGSARALGATLGQGWLFGRPTANPVPDRTVQPLALPEPRRHHTGSPVSPFSCLPPTTVLKRSSKRLLIELSKHLEREAMRIGDTCVVASTFQRSEHFTPATALRYRQLVERTGFVCALGQGLSSEPVPGLRGATLDASDPVRGEWDVVVLSPHFGTALLARDLGDTGPELDRMFEYALTYQREVVTRAAHGLLSRVAPRLISVSPAPGAGDPVDIRVSEGPQTTVPPRSVPGPTGDWLARLALASTGNGATIADMTQPDQPLVYVNAAFERLAGFDAERLLGLNCRFLQGAETDRAAVGRLRTAVAEGRECRETLVNYRGPDRQRWWNEIHLSPVVDDHGCVVNYIGIQNDVTERIRAQQGLLQQTDRAQEYAAQIEHLAYSDPLTGLMNRRGFEDRIEAKLLESCVGDRALALVFMDLDGFKDVNDSFGHAVGDELLVETARRLRARVRGSDLLGRFGGDEFIVALSGLDPVVAATEARAVADELARSIQQPVRLAGHDVRVTVSIGISTCPADAQDFGTLLHLADLQMYERKHPDRPR
ncbi:MAG: diguanylate cyclase, partial [Nocardioidaceae bacterium]